MAENNLITDESPVYDSMQLRQLRLGQESGLDISIYSDPGYDYLQMEELRLGLMQKQDVSVYAGKEIPGATMRQIRLALADGIHLEKFISMDAGILRELHAAVLDRLNITGYINDGYDAEQLREIRFALNAHCNIEGYLDKVYRAPAIREIAIGLEEGLNVSVYADPDYEWQQMREIRLGMEQRLDISIYANPLCSWRQMKQIRLGLEDDLDVTKYCSLMYSYNDMVKRRQELLQEREKSYYVPKKKYLEEQTKIYPEDRITVEWEEDLMEARIYVGGGMADLSVSNIMDLLKQYNITHGIDQRIVEEIAVGDDRSRLVTIARGKWPQAGKDGWYEYFFERVKTEGDTADFFDRYKPVKISRGERAAYYHKATVGISGYRINGEKLNGRPGNGLPMLKGVGFTLLEDSSTYIAGVDGMVESSEGRLEIVPLLTFDEITSVNENIAFNGAIYVHGNVNSGSRVEATGSVYVEGNVENATIESGGSIYVKKGATGNGSSSLKAAKDVIGGFFENTMIVANNRVCAKDFMQCNILSQGNISTFGPDGRLLGGTAFAKDSILVGNLGNKSGIRTEVYIGDLEDINHELVVAQEAMKEIEHQIGILETMYEKYNQTYAPEVRNTMEIYLKMENAIYTKKLDKEYMNTRIQSLEEKKAFSQKAYVTVQSHVYDGVFLHFNQVSDKMWEANNVTYRCPKDKIEITVNEE